MTLDAIVHSDGAAAGAARTHVLIVGVGAYPRIASGAEAPDDMAPIGQLSSPPASARALADWFIADYNYPPAPIGTVALLLSEAAPADYLPPGGAPCRPAAPTYAGFEQAAQAWYRRGTGNEANRLVFVFCGHGYGYGMESSLLMADFDFRAENCWELALDLGKFVAGLEKCAAAEQLFFIDACRREHGDLIPPGAVIGRTPVTVKQNPREGFEKRNRKAPVFFSTGQDEPARAKQGDLSVFTRAFLYAVQGMGARDDTGDWVVDNLSMLGAIDHVSQRLTEGVFADPQQPQGANAQRIEVHRLRGRPVSPVYVVREEGLSGDQLRYRSEDGEDRSEPWASDVAELEIRLPEGTYALDLMGGGEVLARAPRARSAPIFKYARLRP